VKQLALLNTDDTDREDVARLSHPVAILAGGATALPSELRLFAAGEIDTTKGVFLFDAKSAESVMRCSRETGHEIPFDYEHASAFAMFAADPAEAGKAAGWFRPEIRNGECWATGIQWTPKATEKILAKEFRYTSPMFRHDKSEKPRVMEIYNAALTNGPATKQSKPIMNSRASAEPTDAQETPPMKILLKNLGLNETATEAEAITALSAQAAVAKTAQDAIAQLCTLTGKSTTAEALGVLAGWKAAAGEVVELKAKAVEAEKVALAREIDTLIGGAVKDGRLPPAAEKAAREVAQSGVAALKAMLSVLPKHGSPAREPEKGGTGGVETLSAAELEGCKKTGMDPVKFAEHKAKSIASRAA
jgi:phage I-like protein